MRRRIVFSVAALIAVLATPSTTTPPEFKDEAEAVRWYRMAAEQGHPARNWAHVRQRRASRRMRPRSAVRWYRMAASRATPMRSSTLGSCTTSGGRPQGRGRSGALVPDGRRAGPRQRAVQPWGHVRQR